MKVYYAHCKAIYGTPQEKRDVDLLENLGFEVLNPNLPEHKTGCKEYESQFPGSDMNYFTNLVNTCDVLAFRALPTMEIPTGVHKEVNAALYIGIPVIELPSRMSKRGIDKGEMREYLRECGYR